MYFLIAFIVFQCLLLLPSTEVDIDVIQVHSNVLSYTVTQNCIVRELTASYSIISHVFERGEQFQGEPLC